MKKFKNLKRWQKVYVVISAIIVVAALILPIDFVKGQYFSVMNAYNEDDYEVLQKAIEDSIVEGQDAIDLTEARKIDGLDASIHKPAHGGAIEFNYTYHIASIHGIADESNRVIKRERNYNDYSDFEHKNKVRTICDVIILDLIFGAVVGFLMFVIHMIIYAIIYVVSKIKNHGKR